MELITGTNLLLSLALIAQPPQSFNSAPLNRSALEQNAEINAPVEKTTRITISSDSKVIILSGDIEQGAADRFKIVLDAASSVNTVSLISPGGLLTEADKISKLIKMRGLDTYVDQICMSACTMIFLGTIYIASQACGANHRALCARVWGIRFGNGFGAV